MFALMLSLSLAQAADADVGGYVRVMTRPDFQGGDGRLGYWNLYGRLLNEGTWVALQLNVAVLEPVPGTDAVWSRIVAKVEGGTAWAADAGNGSLGDFRLSQLYIEAGNVVLPDVTWQIGTLWSSLGDLGLYDMRPAQIFFDTLGISGRYRTDRAEVMVGFGDSGYRLKGTAYNTIFTPGATARIRLGNHAEVGLGGEFFYEPKVDGNRFAPHTTPGVDYEDYLRGEIVEAWLEDHPGQAINFPDPEPTWASSYKGIAYLGFGNLGPVVWNNLFASFRRLHPEGSVTETVDGQDYTLYVTELTDQRYELLVGDEVQLALWPGRLDVVWAGMVGRHWDLDNTLAPSDHNRWYASSVLRLQGYVSDTVHLLAETSVANEVSTNGNTYRLHVDSIFQSTEGTTDSRGLEYGDSDTRFTWQAKGGVVLNPLGPGVYVRPSLRLLYGLQYSTQNNAFGNSFVETLDQYNEFGNVERHWHHLVALEAEAWF
jgi:hypothetical protein